MVDIKLELPEGYLDEEEREGFLVSREQKQIWAVELDLLNELIRVCQKYDIKFFADGGTMLGAVRHGGFIPWDDDMDFVMTREEFRKLEKVAPKEFRHPYFWQTERTDPGSMRGHAQLRNSETTGILKPDIEKKYQFNQGIFIDIFPLDNLPEDAQERDAFISTVHECRQKALHDTYFTGRFRVKEKGIKRIARNWYHWYRTKIAKKNRDYEKFEEMMTTYDDHPTEYVGKLFFKVFPEKRLWRAEWFSDSTQMPFEMLKIPVSTSYEEIMDRFFGDWRTPVRQDATHGNVVFDTDKSYKEYIKK